LSDPTISSRYGVLIRYNERMPSHQNLCGVYAAALTPLQPDFSPALDDLVNLLDFLAQRGCHGALLLGTTGEGPSFSPSERLEILKAALAVRQKHPDFRLLAGTGTPSLDETARLNHMAFDLGYDGVVVLPPYYFRKATDDGLFAWFSQVIQRSVPEGAALLGYHIPGVTGVPLSLDLLARLKDAFPDRFAGLKDSSSDADMAWNLGQRFGKDLLVYSGTDSLFSLALENQASGCITALANLFSPDLRKVWDAFQAGDSDWQSQSRLDQARLIMNRYPPNPPLYKALLARLGYFPQWSVRPPLLPHSDELLDQVLADAQADIVGFAA
jgi:4-hydroxy-tetrahydrodipicolinate synthase